MAITEDASTPAVVSSSSAVASLTCAAFSPPANSRLVAIVGCFSSGSNGVITVTDSGSHTWTKSIESVGQTTVAIWQCQLTSAPGSITVKATYSNNAGDEYLATRVLNNTASSQTGAATATHLVTLSTAADTYSLTTTQTGSVVYGIAFNWSNFASLTANAATTLITPPLVDTVNGGWVSAWKSTSATGTPGATTFGGTFTNQCSQGNVALEILFASAFAVDVNATSTASSTVVAQAVGPGSVTATSTASPIVIAGAVVTKTTTSTATVAAAVLVTATTTSTATVVAQVVGPGSVSVATTAVPSVIAGAVVTKTTTAAPTVTALAVGPGAVTATSTAASSITGHRTQAGDVAASETASPVVVAAAVGPADVFTASTAAPSITTKRTDTCTVSASSSAGTTVAATAVGPAQINATATASPDVVATVPGRANVVAATTAGVTLATARSDSTGVSMAVLANPAIIAVRSDTAAVTALTSANPAVDGIRTAYADVAASVTAGISVVGTRVHLAAVEAITAMINLMATGVRINPTGPMVATAVRLVGWAIAPDIEIVHSLAGRTTATSAATAIRVRTTTGVSADVDLLH